MKKNITALLQKGNLTPKERVLLLVANQVSEMRDGKRILSEADRHALSEGWKPANNEEVREYNRYNEGWKIVLFTEMDAQTTFLQTKADHFRKFFINMHLNYYPFYRDARNLLERLEKIKVVDIKEATAITEKQREQKLKDGLDFDYAVYLLAFESLSKDLKVDLKTLYEEVEYDHQYLDQEEAIANLFNGKDELTKEAKEKLAELVAERSYNEFAGEYQLHHYFAGIPILEVARRWAREKGLKPKMEYGKKTEKAIRLVAKDKNISEDEAKETLFLETEIKGILENYARDNKTTIKGIIKETCFKWLNDGLLVKDYTPLFNSKQKNTYGEDTKRQHNEIFAEWLKAKKEAKETLQKFIDNSELKIRERTADETRQGKLYRKNGDLERALDFIQTGKEEFDDSIYIMPSKKVITGESLYNFTGDYDFVKDFKERVDKYQANLGIVYAENDPEHKGENIDRELLIATKNDKGELNFFSFFRLTTKKLKNTFEATQFIKETEKDGEVMLDFNNETIKKVFKEIRESLINGYAKLLAFEEIFKRLSKTYETDLTFSVKGWLESVSDFIDQHNNALSIATGQRLHGGDEGQLESFIFNRRKTLKMADDLFIEKEKIKPDTSKTESYFKKFEETLGDAF